MYTNDVIRFNETLRLRTKVFAINVFSMLRNNKTDYLGRSVFMQLIRSSSSVAANFRAATRGRSDAEFYAKICIVVEEIDESAFWLEYLVETGLLQASTTERMEKEAKELLYLFASIKRKLKEKRNST